MPRTFYLSTVNTATAPEYFGLARNSPGTGALGTGWRPAGTTPPNYIQSKIGGNTSSLTWRATSYIDSAIGPIPGIGATGQDPGDSWKTPDPIAGVFVAGDWNLTIYIAGSGGGGSNASVNPRFRIWAGKDSFGTNARELTSGAVTCPPQTVSSSGWSGSFAITFSSFPQITLDYEYLFFQAEMQVNTVFGTTINVGISGSGGQVITPDFYPAIGSAAIMV